MKRTIKALAFTITLVFFMTGTALATSGLTLESAYPADGSEGHELLNMQVRLEFSEDVATEELQESNMEYFSVLGPEGTEEEIIILPSPEDDPKMVYVLLSNEMLPESEYTVVIDGALKSSSGSTLGADKEVKFTTKDPNADMVGTMVMMGLMMVVIIIVMTRSQSKQNASSSTKTSSKPEKVNPYKNNKKK